jgi:hypothetical protein
MSSASIDDSMNEDINISKIMENINVETHNYLDGKTLQIVAQEVYNELESHNLKEYCEVLKNYRFVENICDLQLGKHVRWIRNSKLINGGIVVRVKFMDNGTHVLIKMAKKFIQYKFDECITFQKMDDGEKIFLMSCALL